MDPGSTKSQGRRSHVQRGLRSPRDPVFRVWPKGVTTRSKSERGWTIQWWSNRCKVEGFNTTLVTKRTRDIETLRSLGGKWEWVQSGNTNDRLLRGTDYRVETGSWEESQRGRQRPRVSPGVKSIRCSLKVESSSVIFGRRLLTTDNQ